MANFKNSLIIVFSFILAVYPSILDQNGLNGQALEIRDILSGKINFRNCIPMAYFILLMKISIKNFEFGQDGRKAKASFDHYAASKGYKISSIRDRTRTLDSLTAVDDLIPVENLKIDGKSAQSRGKNILQLHTTSYSLEKVSSENSVLMLEGAPKKDIRGVIRSRAARSNRNSTLGQYSTDQNGKTTHKEIEKILKSYLQVKKKQSFIMTPTHQKQFALNTPTNKRKVEQKNEEGRTQIKVLVHKKMSLRGKNSSLKKYSLYGPWKTEEDDDNLSFF